MADDDFSELAGLAADMSKAPAAASRNILSAIKFTSVELKRDWVQGAERTGLTGYAYSVDFDVSVSADDIVSEIGPNLNRNQGSLGFVEDAPGDVRSAPQHAGRDALRANEDDFFRGLEIALFDATAEAVKP